MYARLLALYKAGRLTAEQLSAAVEPAAQQTARFFRAAVSGGPLDAWLDRDFKGNLSAGGHPAGARSAPAY